MVTEGLPLTHREQHRVTKGSHGSHRTSQNTDRERDSKSPTPQISADFVLSVTCQGKCV